MAQPSPLPVLHARNKGSHSALRLTLFSRPSASAVLPIFDGKQLLPSLAPHLLPPASPTLPVLGASKPYPLLPRRPATRTATRHCTSLPCTAGPRLWLPSPRPHRATHGWRTARGARLRSWHRSGGTRCVRRAGHARVCVLVRIRARARVCLCLCVCVHACSCVSG